VDTGIDATEGGKILQEIRKVSRLPVLYVINTHYHPDHQGGNSVVGANANDNLDRLHEGANAGIDAVLSTKPIYNRPMSRLSGSSPSIWNPIQPRFIFLARRTPAEMPWFTFLIKTLSRWGICS
jgi:hypothetical protein